MPCCKLGECDGEVKDIRSRIKRKILADNNVIKEGD